MLGHRPCDVDEQLIEFELQFTHWNQRDANWLSIPSNPANRRKEDALGEGFHAD